MFFFKQKTAYEMRISDWSSDVCSSDLTPHIHVRRPSGHIHRLRRCGGAPNVKSKNQSQNQSHACRKPAGAAEVASSCPLLSWERLQPRAFDPRDRTSVV